MSPPEHRLQVSDFEEILAKPSGRAIVLKAVSQASGERSVVEIAITTDLAPAMALALLKTTAQTRQLRDGREPALEPLVVGVAASQPGTVRLQILFEQGVLLPVEIPQDAARALSKALREALGD